MEAFYKTDVLGIIERAERTHKANWLKRWWSKKYNLPWRTSPLFKNYTKEELILEFFEDLAADQPEELAKIKVESQKKSNVRFITGDPVIDNIEEMIAKGEEIPENINELLLGKEGAEELAAWNERRTLIQNAAPSGSFSAPEESLEEEPSSFSFFPKEDSD